MSAPTTAVTAGRSVMTVSRGNPVCTAAVAASGAISAGPEHAVAEDGVGAGRDAEGVVADVAGLELAELGAAAAHEQADAVDGAVDDAPVDHPGSERADRLARPFDDLGVQPVDQPR